MPPSLPPPLPHRPPTVELTPLSSSLPSADFPPTSLLTLPPSSPAPPHLPSPSPLFSEWLLTSTKVHLDHGSSGGVPRAIFAGQTALRLRIELGSPDFFLRHFHPLLASSKAALARFLHTETANLALMPGTTHAMNAVLASQTFAPGDELLTTSHAYASTFSLLHAVAARTGARVVTAPIPLAPSSPDEILRLILAATTLRTRFALIDHIPSRTALVFPIATIVRALEARGIDVCVDGAHAPGQIPLDLGALHVPYYVASCHKWMCAPRGVGLLHVRDDRLARIRPVVVARTTYSRDGSAATHTPLQHAFDWFGTFDPSAYGVLPAVVQWLDTLVPGGSAARMAANHALALRARAVVFEAVWGDGWRERFALDEAMVPAMVTVPLPNSQCEEEEGVVRLQRDLWERFDVEVQVYLWPRWPGRTLRFSCQAHNAIEQYVYLGECLRGLLREEEEEEEEKKKKTEGSMKGYAGEGGAGDVDRKEVLAC